MSVRRRFNRFADWVENAVSHPAFFALCVLAVVLWAPSFFLVHNIDTWQLIINTMTTIVTFLLVALLQNTQARFETAVNQRFEKLYQLLGAEDPVDDEGQQPLSGKEGDAAASEIQAEESPKTSSDSQ